MKPREETANTMKFLERMFTVFFDLAMPASKDAKPRFIKNTRIAARKTHKVSTIIGKPTLFLRFIYVKRCCRGLPAPDCMEKGALKDCSFRAPLPGPVGKALAYPRPLE